ncbi:MAG: hypothetical protein L6V35_01145 [Alistipes putredinis]|nr:MAG: hypothetical protein L6V35_01145 [Alistipes putredinis]
MKNIISPVRRAGPVLLRFRKGSGISARCGCIRGVASLFDNNYEITIQPSDQLSILVNVLNKDNAALAAPFNSFVVMAESGAAGQVANMSGATSYLVDADGYINFSGFR